MLYLGVADHCLFTVPIYLPCAMPMLHADWKHCTSNIMSAILNHKNIQILFSLVLSNPKLLIHKHVMFTKTKQEKQGILLGCSVEKY